MKSVRLRIILISKCRCQKPSIQMFTALKILGRECAFVTVEGQDHHITDYEKQKKWVSTYYAWFAKYLQDDDTWWEALYPTKNLR